MNNSYLEYNNTNNNHFILSDLQQEVDSMTFLDPHHLYYLTMPTPPTPSIIQQQETLSEQDALYHLFYNSSNNTSFEEDDEQRPEAPYTKAAHIKRHSNVVSELKRQIHIQSEQKRRAQIKDGFEELRNELPGCPKKKMSKVTLLHKTVQHIQYLKSTQATILAELERLLDENEQLKKFKDNVLLGSQH
ncbi:MAG: hypothetical protein EXX96DRAFT_534448 [Benjaminiella poitrasii]|nr:MAG: hypothetical protein EXX96DRAFT_534448 [Benjaminiella poitrasii]